MKSHSCYDANAKLHSGRLTTAFLTFQQATPPPPPLLETMKVVVSISLILLSYTSFAQGQCIGTPTTACSSQFSARKCGTACNSATCNDSQDFCEFACNQPGCYCDIDIQGQCSFNPALDGDTIISCQGVPTQCSLLGSEVSCEQVEGCTWAGPPGLPDEPGTCVGAGISSCSQQYDTSTCSACNTGECLLEQQTCGVTCTHPGCLCGRQDGVCTTNFRSSIDTVIGCVGTPNPCGSITDSTSCGNALNCVWIPSIPSPAPVANILPDGICRGTPAFHSCSGLYPPFAYRQCQGLPAPQYNLCLTGCERVPGCQCFDDQGVCGSVVDEVGLLSCGGTPTPCGNLDNLNDCTAAGCQWEAFIGTEPTRSPTTYECDVDLELSCVNSDGNDCSTIEPPADNKCPTSDIFTLWFEYTATGCNNDSNQQGSLSTCQDLGTISSTQSVVIDCVDSVSTTRLNVQPDIVAPGQRFSVTRDRVGALPNSIACSIRTDAASSTALQIISFQANNRAGIDLDLKDGFGALQVMQCDSLTCLDLFTYSTKTTNVGLLDTVLVRYNIDLAFAPAQSVLDQVANPVLAPNGVAEAAITQQVDICEEGNNGGTVNIGVSPGGTVAGQCATSKTIALEINPPCNLQVGLSCAGYGSLARDLEGIDCAFLNRETETTCRCGSGAREIRFRYTGKKCAANVAGSGFTCEDLSTASLPSTVDVIVRLGETTLYSQNGIAVGKDVVFTNNNSFLPDTFSVLVIVPGTSQVIQRIQITSNCARAGNTTPLTFLRDYGSLSFSGYSCNANRVHNCYLEVEHKSCAENDGLSTRTIDEYQLELVYPRKAPVLIDLLLGGETGDSELLPGESLCKSYISEIELCRGTGQHLAIASATLEDLCSDGNTGFEEKQFDLVPDPSQAPTRTPSINIDPENPAPSPPSGPSGPSGPSPSVPTPNGCGPKPVFAPSAACP